MKVSVGALPRTMLSLLLLHLLVLFVQLLVPLVLPKTVLGPWRMKRDRPPRLRLLL